MKKFLTISRLLFFTFLIALIAACSNDDEGGNIIDTDESIADFVESNPDFSMLNEALDITGLDETLDEDGLYTVFAPNNAAFSAYLGDASLNEVEVATLRNLLLNHVISFEATLSSELNTGYLPTTATFADSNASISLYISTENSVNLNGGSNLQGGATVIDADNELSNGVVHAVDAVIALPTVATFASVDPNFSTLVMALTREDDFNYVETLSTVDSDPAPFTVFAPTNAAFTALLEELDLTSLDEIDTETLEASLNLHVIASANVREEDITDGPVTTLGGEITVDAENATITDINGRTSALVITDVQAANGVIHAIDRVLLPELETQQTIAGFVAENEDYSLLLAALQQTGLDAALDAEGTFTVFAPNNEAFETYLQGAELESIENDVLAQLLYNHVLNTTILSGDLSTGYVSNMATFNNTDANISSYININDGVMINGEATVTGADNEFSNGVIHAVDAVIPMPTVVTFATADPNFETLAAALTRDDSFTFAATLSTMVGVDPAPFTVFAPTNDAFSSLLTELDFGGLDEVPSEVLEATLNTHVIAGANVRAADLESGEVETLGGTVTIDAENTTITDMNNRTSTIILTDVQASNGVIHAIDNVLLPMQ